MVEVFKTNVQDSAEAILITEELYRHLSSGRVSFDLEDCDKVLRVETERLIPEEITGILEERGYTCEVLE